MGNLLSHPLQTIGQVAVAGSVPFGLYQTIKGKKQDTPFSAPPSSISAPPAPAIPAISSPSSANNTALAALNPALALGGTNGSVLGSSSSGNSAPKKLLGQ